MMDMNARTYRAEGRDDRGETLSLVLSLKRLIVRRMIIMDARTYREE
jgi:hypothetical protein